MPDDPSPDTQLPGTLLPACPIPPGPILLGFSGGLDSTVLLHWLSASPHIRERGLRALYVDHGLQAAASRWTEHCRHVAADWGIAFTATPVTVARDGGTGMEAAAREARRAAFAAALQPGECLALAHHRDDQAETFLLRALRGSGVDGLAAMQPLSRFVHGSQHVEVWRPLLDIPRARLLEYARRHRLQWIEDPTNADPAVADRNFLRQQVLPLLETRWPHAAAALARSAALSAQASATLQRQDAALLEGCQRTDDMLAVEELLQLDAAQRARVLRHWVARLDAPPLPAAGVDAIERQLLPASHDSAAEFAWQHVRIRRWRNQLHLLGTPSPFPAEWVQWWNGAQPLPLPDGGRLALDGARAFDAPMQVGARRGGERLVLPGRTHSHALKDLLQQGDIPPWQRQQLPVLRDAAGTVLAAGNRIVSAQLHAWLQGHGARLQWSPGR